MGDGEEEMNGGFNSVKKMKIGQKNGFEEGTSYGPHVIKVMDEDMLARVCQKYETSGSSSFQSSNGISEDCAPAAMSRCTDPLKVVTDNRDLGFATSMDELQEMCPKLMEGLRCIDDFTVRCLDREHRAYFNTLYAGTTQVIVDLCQEGSYQSDYLRHAPCMRQVQSGYERCASEYQQRIKSLNSGAGDHAQGRSEEYGDYEEYEYEYEEEGSKKRRKKRQAPTVHDSH